MVNESESMEDIKHEDSGEIPEGLQEAEDPKYEVSENVILLTDHMPGMKGAIATIDSFKDTSFYMVDYKPTIGGKAVKNHKWVMEISMIG